MKTILWATLTANGNYQRNDAQHPPRPEALADFAEHVRGTGNFVVGRRTFEMFASRPAPEPGPSRSPDQSSLGTPTIVVVSASAPPPGVLGGRGVREALGLLRDRGFSKALIGGGERLHNALLAEDLVDELVLNVVPELEDEGFKLLLPKGRHQTPTLVATRELGGGVVQLRYDLRKR